MEGLSANVECQVEGEDEWIELTMQFSFSKM